MSLEDVPIDSLIYMVKPEYIADYRRITSEMEGFQIEVTASLEMILDFIVRHKNNADTQKQGQCLYLETCTRSESQMIWFYDQRQLCFIRELQDITDPMERHNVVDGFATFVRYSQQVINNRPNIKQDTIDQLAILEQTFAEK